MRAVPTDIPEVLVFEADIYGDARGFLFEAYNRSRFARATGSSLDFVQDNYSWSTRGVLRGLHYQMGNAQGKFARVLTGEVYHVAVDLRRSSRTFRQCVQFILTAESKRGVWVPPGFAHGFLVVSESAGLLYKTTDYYAADSQRTLLWSDPDLGIKWPLEGNPVVSERDRQGTPLARAETFE